ncbi:hypothetical protein BCR33DRAFT_714288 [Rhizoclosmatium globosum]|uniref:PCI domain-containing protein n=1 Tax=Rhizoclosmatium globosum TaxID=329046 RepID=A0A1Y2CNJ3_9FUNG|nr:hypothetical protein BCR33DRAFT_714288 [Rhizoclosmatium globosum]|eukprot:ORY48516.1 hypothetical protein BCR33DRAFT_714288 [Rhizoclosmatium globosum]
MSLLSRLGPKSQSQGQSQKTFKSSTSPLGRAFLNSDATAAASAVALGPTYGILGSVGGDVDLAAAESESEVDVSLADLAAADDAIDEARAQFNAGNYPDAFATYNYAAQLIHNNAASTARWFLAALFQLNLNLYSLAVKGDETLANSHQKTRCLEEAARTMNKAFSVCATDRFNNINQSRKWGVYYICNLLFRTYFKLNQINLASNLIRSFRGVDLPDLSLYPIAHVVTYRYYMGVLAFYDEQYRKAQDDLSFALINFAPLTTPARIHNRKLLLTHLIPINLLSGISPSDVVYSNHPELSDLFGDLVNAIEAGKLGSFDELLQRKQKGLIRAGVYLTIERCRIICFRNLARRVFLIRGKPTRLELQDILTAVTVAGCEADMDEIECMVANLIDKGLLKGYISHEKLMLVLSPNNAFPSLDSVPV